MKTTKWLKFNFDRDGWSDNHENRNDAYVQFARDFRSDVKSMLKNTNWKIDKMSVSHFFISAFLHNEETDRFVYISISDVRYFKDEWSTNMLIRTAKSNVDYTGGYNQFCHFHNLTLALTNF